MIHVEDTMKWRQATSDPDVADSARIAALASIVGGGSRGAKLSLQSDLLFLDQNADQPPANKYTPAGAPTSLKWVIDHGGNFWCHTHDRTGTHLRSVHSAVASAFAVEASASY